LTHRRSYNMDSKQLLPIFDGHNDFSEKLDKGGGKADLDVFFSRRDNGHLDLPRAREGGFAGGLFAIYIDPPEPTPEEKATRKRPDTRLVSHERAREITLRRIEYLKQLETRDSSAVAIVRSVKDIEAALAAKKIAISIHLEGAEAVDPELKTLADYYSRGVRSIGITWSRENAFGYGVPFDFPGSPDSGPGLKDAGKALVKECNRLGILVDMSHLNEKGFWDVAKISSAPLVASHSCVHALCPTPRNLTDKQLDAIKASDGIVGINFSVSFLRPDGKREIDTPLSIMADHFAYVADRIGVEHVGMGSDFDGTTISKHLGDSAGLPKLIAEIRSRGFSDKDMEKIAYKNWLRVLGKTWNSL
jgi:membrane dipeptidase